METPIKKMVSPIDYRSILKGAAILAAALAWNEAAKEVITYLFPLNEQSNKYMNMIATLIYAIFVTILIIMIITGYNFTLTIKNNNLTHTDPKLPNEETSSNSLQDDAEVVEKESLKNNKSNYLSHYAFVNSNACDNPLICEQFGLTGRLNKQFSNISHSYRADQQQNESNVSKSA